MQLCEGQLNLSSVDAIHFHHTTSMLNVFSDIFPTI